MNTLAYQLAVIIVVVIGLCLGLMALESAAVNAKGAYAMDLQRIAWKSYQHQIDMKNLPRPEWHRAF